MPFLKFIIFTISEIDVRSVIIAERTSSDVFLVTFFKKA